VAIIYLDRPLPTGSAAIAASNLPAGVARAELTGILGLAGGGVYPADDVAATAVRSYRTFSPLPGICAGRYVFCGTGPRVTPGGR